MPYGASQTPTAGNTPAPPAAPTQGGVYGAISGLMSNPGTAATGVIGALAAPGIAQSGLSMAQLLQEIGLAGPSAQETAAYNTQQLALGEAGLGIQEGQNTLQRQGLSAQEQLAQLQQGLETQEFGLSERGRRDQAAANGTLTTGAYSQAEQQAGLAQAGEVAGYQFSLGDIARSQQNLELAAAANGISLQQLQSQWAQGLNTLGLQGDPTQLYTQYLSQQGNQVQGLGSAAAEGGLLTPGQLAQGAMAGGFNPNALFAGVG